MLETPLHKRHVSPSQLVQFYGKRDAAGEFVPESGCRRKWAYKRHVRAEDTDAQRAGKRGHTLVETYLRDGVLPDVDEWMGGAVWAGLQHLPEPGTAHVEREQRLVRYGVEYRFAADGYWWTHLPQRADRPWLSARSVRAKVLDHKFTSDLQYALTPGELAWDWQFLIYGWHAIFAAPKGRYVEDVHGRWVYYKKSKPYASKAVDVLESRLRLQRRFDEHVHPLALALVKESDDPADQPRNMQHCYAWNRPCEFITQCQRGLSRGKIIGSIMALDKIIDDEDEKPKRRRSKDEDEDDEKPKRRRSRATKDDDEDDEDDEDEDDAPKRRRSRAKDEDDDEKPKRRRSRATKDDDEDDEGDDVEVPSRKRREAAEDDEKPARRRGRSAPKDDDEDDEKPARGRRKAPLRTGVAAPPVTGAVDEAAVRMTLLHAALIIGEDPSSIEPYVKAWKKAQG